MECKVKSPTPPTAKWMKDGVPLQMGGLYHAIFTDLGDQTYLCQLEIRGPSVSDAGQYRCNLRNEQGETNANLALNFEEPEPNERQEKKVTHFFSLLTSELRCSFPRYEPRMISCSH
ncbi:unnamed protein product [Cylicostephanus goldi]|uniref:Ig-like domain-containing protein n=1 Tax=Cylicostephanus goldi TaxID=71465 RepID=A0A3P6UEP0_CYLGO|nr:unnamed protein product [Cylicostephanus goldi]